MQRSAAALAYALAGLAGAYGLFLALVGAPLSGVEAGGDEESARTVSFERNPLGFLAVAAALFVVVGIAKQGPDGRFAAWIGVLSLFMLAMIGMSGMLMYLLPVAFLLTILLILARPRHADLPTAMEERRVD